ncbi:MAG: metallophosphoesterase family protein [Opitutaceae bacterium]|nr:metallophosphoesterase family protein [Opitutaceae bacterium]
MRVAVLSDIHGNLPALEAVLDALPRLGVTQTVIAGDVVNGSPDSRACWDLVHSLRLPLLRGNHERYVFDLHSERAKPEWATLQFAPVHFTYKQFDDAIRMEMARLPILHRDPELPGLLVVHASPRNDHDLVFPYTRESDLDAMFSGATERTFVRGHNHYAGITLWRGRHIVNAGSVGLPLDGSPKAQFVILELKAGTWRAEHHAIAYDVARAVRRFEETGYLDEGGPLAHLYMKEVETASFRVVPFLKFQTAYLARQPGATLLDAWAAYRQIGY